MASVSDYQIRALLRSEEAPNNNTGAFSGEFNTWQDLGTNRVWTITIDPTDAYGKYTRKIDFEIRNKNTLEVVSTTSGDFEITADTSSLLPQYSTSSPKYFWRDHITDEIYWNDTLVFSGGGLTGTEYIATDGYKYLRGNLVTSNSGGSFYEITREEVVGNINDITGDTVALYVSNGTSPSASSGTSSITFNTNGTIYGSYIVNSGIASGSSDNFQKPWFTGEVNNNNYEIRAVRVSGDTISNTGTWLSMGLNRTWIHTVSHQSNTGSNEKDTVLYFQIREKSTGTIVETTGNFTIFARAIYYYESGGGGFIPE